MGNEKTATFTMRMEPEKKRHMEEFFEGLGVSLASGVNIFFEQCIIEAGLPFEVKLGREKKLPAKTEPAPKTAQLTRRLDPYKKSQVEYTFRELGMTVSEAVNIYFEKCLSEWGIPFRVGYPKPNETTLAAMAESVDESEAFSSMEEMLKDLDD